MNKQTIAGLVVGLVATVVGAAADTSVLLMGPSCKRDGGQIVVAGPATAQIKQRSGDFNITAAEIVVRDGEHVLRCAGKVTIDRGGIVTRGEKLEIDLGEAAENIWVLNKEGIMLGGTASLKQAADAQREAGGKLTFENWPENADAAPFQTTGATLKPSGGIAPAPNGSTLKLGTAPGK